MSEDILVNPDDVKKRRKKKESEDKELIKAESTLNEVKYFNRGETLRVSFETQGRFDMPVELFFEDYNMQHVNDLTLSRKDEVLENLVVIMNDLVNKDAEVDIGDMVIEEFLESLVGLKMEYNTRYHTHRWVCKCQHTKEPEQQTVNEHKLDLATLNYVPVTDADEKLKKYYREELEKLSPEDYTHYLYKKYKNDPLEDIEGWSIDKEIESIKISEPMSTFIGEDRYSFRFMRVKDFVESLKLAKVKWEPKLKRIESQKIHGMGLAEMKAKKEKESEDVRYNQSKDTLLYARALSLVAKNGQVLTTEEKIEIFPKLRRKEMLEFMKYMDKINFGVDQELELSCQICGETERRSLRQELNPIELLPLESNTEGDESKSRPVNIFIGS